MKAKMAKAEKRKESSSAFFQNLRPKFLDWQPPTEEEKALEVRGRSEAREAELKRVTELAKGREAEKAGIARRNRSAAARKK
jgi:hypothetical protein